MQYTMNRKGIIMTQIHKRFAADQVKVRLTAYLQGHITRIEVENTLGIGKTRFFALLRQFQNQPDAFSIQYQRSTPTRLEPEIADQISTELLRDKQRIEENTVDS